MIPFAFIHPTSICAAAALASFVAFAGATPVVASDSAPATASASSPASTSAPGTKPATATTSPALLDDFSHAARSSVGATRLLIDDKGLGSQSSATQTCTNGVVTVKGSLVPGRGVPAFISFVLLVAPDAKPRDLGQYEGIRLRLKITAGLISVQAGSSEITNHDYHTSPLAVKGADFQELRVPFKDMKRAFSEQTPLNLKTIVSINLVAFGMAKSDFSYEVDEISFY